jgi:superoxide reductase
MEQKNVVFYSCNTCGNIVTLLHEGGGTLVCCGNPMEKLIAKTGDVGAEKHVPVITHEGGKLIAKCGEIPHPMTEVHHIEWMALVTDGRVRIVWLKHEGEPKAEWGETEHGIVYAYCNIHGLWKKEF